MNGAWQKEGRKHRNNPNWCNEQSGDLGETVVVGWTGRDGRVLVGDLGNEA